MKKILVTGGCGFIGSNFSKKLMGQIVFLYFSQKKGWLGVKKDSDWGSGEKRYSSKEKTQYKSNENIVNADKGVDINMQSEQTKLLGDVKVVNGFGSSLASYDLTIDQSNGGEIFKSDSPSRFQSNTVDIKAKKMHYDAITKKLKLTDEVKATYE